jgi:hypothetical protein
MTTTFEEAKLCPKCGLPGEEGNPTPARNGRGQPVKVFLIWCRNEACKWFNTNWVVQINPDGTVPTAFSQVGDKQYPRLSQESQSRIEDNIMRQLKAETQAGAEVINPKDPRRGQ